jgi:hypothetical protein
MHSQYESNDPHIEELGAMAYQEHVQGIADETNVKRPRTAWKGEYEKISLRYQSMKATAAVGYILALIEAIAISLLIFN